MEIVAEYNDINEEQIKDVYNFYHQREFMDIEELKDKAKSFENIYDISNTDAVDELKYVKNMIRGYIRSNFEIDDNPKNLLKANYITSNIENNLPIYIKDKVKLKWAISKVLLSINLKKKRLSDGIYYYGIKHKYQSFKNPTEEYKKRLADYSK